MKRRRTKDGVLHIRVMQEQKIKFQKWCEDNGMTITDMIEKTMLSCIEQKPN